MKEKSPNLIFVMKIKLKVGKYEVIKRKMGLENCFVVDSIGKGRFSAVLKNGATSGTTE